jgi:hypothetical protein
MRLPEWLKKDLKDPGTQKLLAGILAGSPIFSIAQKFVNNYDWLSWETWQASALAYAFIVVVYLPLAYFHRNSK